MSDKAAIKLERGAKRTCQNPECGSRFYDLNRDPIICPICNTAYVIATQPAPEIPVRSFARPYKKPPPFVPNEPKQKVPTEDVEQIALENEEDTAPAEEDDTLIEEVDEDSPDMAGIVDAPEDNDKQ